MSGTSIIAQIFISLKVILILICEFTCRYIEQQERNAVHKDHNYISPKFQPATYVVTDFLKSCKRYINFICTTK